MTRRGLLIAWLVWPCAAHIGLFQVGAYGWTRDDRYDLADPLNMESVDWFCRGLDSSTAGGMIELHAGSNVSLSLVRSLPIAEQSEGSSRAKACSKADAATGRTCPDNPGSLHDGSTGDSGPKPEAVVGCALAIAYGKPTKMDDFAIISVLRDCPAPVATHIFQLPLALPNGEATGAWLWIPSPMASADEMYQTARRYVSARRDLDDTAGSASSRWSPEEARAASRRPSAPSSGAYRRADLVTLVRITTSSARVQLDHVQPEMTVEQVTVPCLWRSTGRYHQRASERRHRPTCRPRPRRR